MIGFRPKPSALFLERPRLLRLLPEEPGYVVWLEAPYGYGKSVLISQWTNQLEADGWRVVWLAMVESDPRAGLASALGLPEATPWRSVLESLGQERTAVVLEDLEGDSGAGLGPLLKHAQGLVLLASRRPLRDPEFVRLRTQGRLVHVKAAQLAFTTDEAARLFGDTPGALEAWEHTRGWSLPLHMAALTGAIPDEVALWDGVRESLEPDEWREVLFMAALPYLPASAADPRAGRLADLGFVQALENGYRLHPLAAEQLLANRREAVQEAVKLEASRLEVAWRCLALERAGLPELLAPLLEDHKLVNFDPQALLRWDALCRTERGPERWLGVSWARSVVGQREAAMEAFLAAARHNDATIAQRLMAMGWALYDLQPHERALAERLMLEAQPWLERASPRVKAVYLSNVGAAFVQMGDWVRAQRHLEEACAIPELEQSSDARGVHANLMNARWEQSGELEGFIHFLERATELDRRGEGRFLPFNLPVRLRTLGGLLEWLDPNRALACYAELETLAHHNLLDALRARAQAASVRGELDRFADLADEAQAWNDLATIALVRSRWARTLRLAGRAEQGLKVMEALSDLEILPERALCLHALGRDTEALEVLEPALEASARQVRLQARAARYRIARDPDDLEGLILLTDLRERVLPGLVPLEELPRSRANLARAYPLESVLRSGWKEAVQTRLEQIPVLELRVLGGFEACVLGEPVTLTARPRDILLLLALRLPRDRIAEALWSDADTDKSRNNLHVNLNALRKVLEPWGVPTYILESGLARARVDLWDLEEALKRHDFRRVRERYADLAPGFDLLVLEEYRDDLRERVLDAVLDHATALEHSNPGEAEDALEWLLERDPVHEEAFSSLLALLVASGRRVTAERRYRAFARRLRDEMGLEPAQEIRRIVGVA